MMPNFRLLTPDAQYADDGVIERQTTGPDVEWTIFRAGDRDGRDIPSETLSVADALVVWHEMTVDETFINKLDSCRIIVRAGVGFDHIDLEAAGRAGIAVCNTPDYGTSEVADHAIGLMLALSRGILGYDAAMRRDPIGNFEATTAPLVRRIRGRVFGIVGLGRIGIATALRAKAFGMRVVAYDPYVPAGTEIAVGVTRVTNLADLLAQSDVVSLHAPLTAMTRGMINSVTLSQMKPDAVLINTARGALVDVAALIANLDAGKLAGAGLDVLPEEPPLPGSPVALALGELAPGRLAPRLIVTPHAAWFSPESREDARRLSAETAIQFLRSGQLRNLVNGEHWVSCRCPTTASGK
jgi:phosphoglycerate dehydrogenase-like enzyme